MFSVSAALSCGRRYHHLHSSSASHQDRDCDVSNRCGIASAEPPTPLPLPALVRPIEWAKANNVPEMSKRPSPNPKAHHAIPGIDRNKLTTNPISGDSHDEARSFAIRLYMKQATFDHLGAVQSSARCGTTRSRVWGPLKSCGSDVANCWG
jgi:hypothetical protein